VVGKKRRSRPAPAGGHNRCWIWGRHAVTEAVQAGRWRPIELLVDESALKDEPHWLGQAAQTAGIPVTLTTSEKLTRLSGASDHQGLLARMPVFPYVSETDLLDRISRSSFVLVLSGIQDPYNFGSILRSAEIFGAEAVIVPQRGQADVTPHVARSSAGAVNYLQIARTESLPDCCRRLKALGLSLAGATEKGSIAPSAANFSRGTALIIGNEGTGIDAELLDLCDLRVRIPQAGHVGSLNAAVAAGILCYEVHRQRSSQPS